MCKRFALTDEKSGEVESVNPTSLIERLKRLKALDLDPSQHGIHQYTVKSSAFGKINILQNGFGKDLF